MYHKTEFQRQLGTYITAGSCTDEEISRSLEERYRHPFSQASLQALREATRQGHVIYNPLFISAMLCLLKKEVQLKSSVVDARRNSLDETTEKTDDSSPLASRVFPAASQ